ncbi:YbaK/EbsC family protein [Vitreoscilla stercoraria]|uniref:YbaK/EbsC family protein n=2 Tax=Neisseriaceae TaxID=481 RepID=A0ABY4E8E8_VITST|nr:YbaK/EbsC family protein [Vitreoscilla stercoraria]
MEDLLMSESVQKVHHILETKQVVHQLRLLSDSTRTAQMAADVLGCTPSEIASSLIFEEATTGQLILIVASGGHRVDIDFVSQQLGKNLQMAKGKRIKQEVGFAIGGVPPLAHNQPLETWLDVRLLQYPIVWAAAGSPFAVFGANPQELQRVTGAQWLAVEEADLEQLA